MDAGGTARANALASDYDSCLSGGLAPEASGSQDLDHMDGQCSQPRYPRTTAMDAERAGCGKALVLAVDYDGCLSSKGCLASEESCSQLIEHVQDYVDSNEVTHLYVTTGSNRQSAYYNAVNMQTNSNGDCFESTEALATMLRRHTSVPVVWVPVLTADPHQNMPPGSEVLRSASVASSHTNQASTIFDTRKVITMTFLVNYMVLLTRTMHGSGQLPVDVLFVDDRLDLLESVSGAMKALSAVCLPEGTRLLLAANAGGHMHWGWPDIDDLSRDVEHFAPPSAIVGTARRILPSYAFWWSMRAYAAKSPVGEWTFSYTPEQVQSWIVAKWGADGLWATAHPWRSWDTWRDEDCSSAVSAAYGVKRYA
jgi:hypothetical protein